MDAANPLIIQTMSTACISSALLFLRHADAVPSDRTRDLANSSKAANNTGLLCTQRLANSTSMW